MTEGDQPEARPQRRVLLIGGALSDEERAFDRHDAVVEDEADVRVEEAALSVMRGVLSRGDRLAVIDDPVLTPLACEVATEYQLVQPVILVGASRDAEPASAMMTAFEGGYAVPVSLREARILRIHRIVCVGGTPLTLETLGQFTMLSTTNAQRYAFPSTGGAARIFAEQRDVRDAEDEVRRRIMDNRNELRFRIPETGESAGRDTGSLPLDAVPDFVFAMYPLAVSVMLDDDAG